MYQQTLFDHMATPESTPLASRLRPESLEEYVGQEHLLSPGAVLYNLIEQDQIASMIFWGPPGVGKTTLASIIAARTKAEFITFSAVTSGIKEIREVMIQADTMRSMGKKTILFVDEIHRFNKAQQDAFLPYVEKGSIILIGATTENPSFELNSALLSRCKVFVLQALARENLVAMLKRALSSEKGFASRDVKITDEMLEAIADFSNGDARVALNSLDMVILNGQIQKDASILVTKETLAQCLNKRSLLYDKKGEEHYNIISALHKSMRNSDVDAALYWMTRMLEGGENPLYIARRLIRFASEDIGIADSNALNVAINVYQACHFNGMPECDVNLAHAVTYLSLAPKSNALYLAVERAKKDASETLAEPVPLQIRNAPTSLMKDLKYGEGYQYAHDSEDKLTTMSCLPDSMHNRVYYEPTEQGEEKKAKEHLEYIQDYKSNK